MSQEVIQAILDTHNTGSKSCIEEEDGAQVDKLSLLMNVGSNNKKPVSKDFYMVGSIKDRGERRSSILSVDKKGLQRRIGNITLELALFPFLFLNDNGAYDGTISMQDYLKYRMNCMFSPFMLHKPYLSLMYDIRQSLMLINGTWQMCLEKDYHAIQTRNPTMSHEDIIGQLCKIHFTRDTYRVTYLAQESIK